MQLERYDVIISSALQPASQPKLSQEHVNNNQHKDFFNIPSIQIRHIISNQTQKLPTQYWNFIMPRGNAHQSKVHYHGKEEDFVVYVDDIKSVQNWKIDRSIPLAQVVSGFKIFITHKYDYSSSPDLRFCYSVDRALADRLSNRF